MDPVQAAADKENQAVKALVKGCCIYCIGMGGGLILACAGFVVGGIGLSGKNVDKTMGFWGMFCGVAGTIILFVSCYFIWAPALKSDDAQQINRNPQPVVTGFTPGPGVVSSGAGYYQMQPLVAGPTDSSYNNSRYSGPPPRMADSHMSSHSYSRDEMPTIPRPAYSNQTTTYGVDFK